MPEDKAFFIYQSWSGGHFFVWSGNQQDPVEVKTPDGTKVGTFDVDGVGFRGQASLSVFKQQCDNWLKKEEAKKHGRADS